MAGRLQHCELHVYLFMSITLSVIYEELTTPSRAMSSIFLRLVLVTHFQAGVMIYLKFTMPVSAIIR